MTVKYPRKISIFCLCLVALYGLGCKTEKAQDIRPAERVELLVQDENDPRPYFHAELKFADADQIKLPGNSEELEKRIKVREASSLFIREGRDFTPFKVSNRAVEGKLDVMMVFDLSGSMKLNLEGRSRLEAAKDAARVLIHEFRPGDRFAIAPFESHDVRAKIENAVFAETREEAEEQIARLQPREDGNTALYSAAIFALERLQKLKKTDRQYMLVILTDGQNDLRSGDDPEVLRRKDDLNNVINKLNETNIQTFTIGVGDGIDASALQDMVYPRENKEQYTNVKNPQSLIRFLTRAKQALTEQIGIMFFTRHRDYHELKSLNFNVQVETLDGRILQGTIPWNCRAASGCAPDKTMEREEMRLVTERADAPQPPDPQWKELLWLLGRFAIALVILAGLWWGIPKIVWPVTPLPQIPRGRGTKLPPSRSGQKSRFSPSVPEDSRESRRPGSVSKPRQGFEETRIHDNKSSNLRNRDE
ncbi:MAG: VWA domain-containing protein [Blastocatellia bacterium]|nr:VWA domain-containing protein [Blastocatellia bacterium]